MSGRREVLEMRPAQIFVRTPPRPCRSCSLLSETRAPLDRLLQPRAPVLLQCVEVIEAPQEHQQIRNLLDHLERIGNASRPEGVPDLIDLTLMEPVIGLR